jgi:hypothetical protein
VRECVCAGPRWVVGKVELTGGPTGQRGKKGAHARATSADRAAPLGRGRGGGGARGEKLPLTGGAHLSGGARAAPLGWTGPVWAELRFSIFLEFLITFLFYFL